MMNRWCFKQAGLWRLRPEALRSWEEPWVQPPPGARNVSTVGDIVEALGAGGFGGVGGLGKEFKGGLSRVAE